MDEQTTPLSEPMAARIEIEDLGSATRQKELSDTLGSLPGVSEVKIEKGALHVIYDPLQTSEKKIGEAIRGTGSKIAKTETDTQVPHPDTS